MPMGGLRDITVRPNSKHEWLKSFFLAHPVEVCLFVSSSLLIDTKQQRKISRFRCISLFWQLQRSWAHQQRKPTQNENCVLCNNKQDNNNKEKNFQKNQLCVKWEWLVWQATDLLFTVAQAGRRGLDFQLSFLLIPTRWVLFAATVVFVVMVTVDILDGRLDVAMQLLFLWTQIRLLLLFFCCNTYYYCFSLLLLVLLLLLLFIFPFLLFCCEATPCLVVAFPMESNKVGWMVNVMFYHFYRFCSCNTDPHIEK